MRIVYTVVFIPTVILNSIELSLQFDCLPNGAPIPGVLCDGPSSFPPGIKHRLTSPDSSLRSSSSDEPDRRERSRSLPLNDMEPPNRLPSSDGLGYGLDQLEFIRLTPTRNSHQQFELRRYTFPGDQRIKLFARHNVYPPVPRQEQIVLSTLSGEVYAILRSNKTLAGLYKHNPSNKCKNRVKVNIENGTTIILTTDEIEEVPVGPNRPIQYHFRVENLHGRNGSSSPVGPSSPDRTWSTAASSFSYVLGYRLDQLQFLRLRCKVNPQRMFELRRHTFPVDSRIMILAGRHSYRPIPIEEKIVLSTFLGDIFALYESSNILAGIYLCSRRTKCEARAKINMRTGTVTSLTPDEIKETPVGPNRSIKFHYEVEHVNQRPPDA